MVVFRKQSGTGRESSNARHKRFFQPFLRIWFVFPALRITRVEGD
jgi:hypothetical protein